MKEDGFAIILLAPSQPSFSSSVPVGFNIIIVIPRAATWGGGLLSDLNVVSSLLSTTLSAAYAAATWGSASFRIWSAMAFCSSI